MIIFTNVLVAIIAAIIILYLMKKDLGLFLLSFIIFLQYIWMFFSLVVIENGIFMNEQGRNGYFVYSTLILFCFFISTLISLIFFKKLFTKLFKSVKGVRFNLARIRDKEITLSIVIVIVFLAYLNLSLSPVPLFSDTVTRFSFWEHSKLPFLKSVTGNVMGFVGFGIALLYRYYKKTSIFLLILFFSYLILIGQKFSGILIGSFGLVLAFYYTSSKKINFKLKWVFNKYTIVLFAGCFYLVLYSYTKNNPFKYLGLTPMESIFYRAFGLQAHVFWGVTEQYVYLDKPNTWNIYELFEGMKVLMEEFWPFKIEYLEKVTSRGVNWTNAYPAILIRIFPLPIALIVNFVLMSFVSLVQFLLSEFIKKRAILLSILFFQLLTWVSYAYTMAYFNKLLVPLICVTFYFLFEYLRYKTRQNANTNGVT